MVALEKNAWKTAENTVSANIYTEFEFIYFY